MTTHVPAPRASSSAKAAGSAHTRRRPPQQGNTLQREKNQDRATTGETLANTQERQSTARGKAPENSAEEKRKTLPMKTNIESRALFSAFRRSVKNAVEASPQELVAPHEWAGLLHNFESDNTASAATAIDSETESEDLWEKLSSTRWIKTPPQDHDTNSSTVTSR
jgi:hypothetical protein